MLLRFEYGIVDKCVNEVNLIRPVDLLSFLSKTNGP